jgi:hypothetical protein
MYLMNLPVFYPVSEKIFCLKPDYRPAVFEIEHPQDGQFQIKIKNHIEAEQCLTQASVVISAQGICVRHLQGEPLNEQDHNFLSKLPRMLSFLGVEDKQTRKFNELFYGLFWESVPF